MANINGSLSPRFSKTSVGIAGHSRYSPEVGAFCRCPENVRNVFRNVLKFTFNFVQLCEKNLIGAKLLLRVLEVVLQVHDLDGGLPGALGLGLDRGGGRGDLNKDTIE